MDSALFLFLCINPTKMAKVKMIKQIEMLIKTKSQVSLLVSLSTIPNFRLSEILVVFEIEAIVLPPFRQKFGSISFLKVQKFTLTMVKLIPVVGGKSFRMVELASSSSFSGIVVDDKFSKHSGLEKNVGKTFNRLSFKLKTFKFGKFSKNSLPKRRNRFELSRKISKRPKFANSSPFKVSSSF
uniref:Uncharacterized protein n=1 Tax=Romanomermis culicivorax TaxID=13658 RepID=A0A915ICA3_ROMCU